MSWLAAHREVVLARVIALMVAAIGAYAPAFVGGSSLLGVLDDTALVVVQRYWFDRMVPYLGQVRQRP